jgi:hypothetical protein
MAICPVVIPPASRRHYGGYSEFPVEVLYERLPLSHHQKVFSKSVYWNKTEMSDFLKVALIKRGGAWFKAVRIKYNLSGWDDIMYPDNALLQIKQLEKELTDANAC